MFTGLIQAVGAVERAVAKGSPRLTINSPLARQLTTGSSIAVSGVCLTALEVSAEQFSADLAQETVARTNLSQLETGASVNLELPARADSRLDGHIVQGHVDGIARLVSLVRVGEEDWRLTIELDEKLRSGVVPQGSVTVEGISLTVADLRGTKVEIAIIPHTYEATNLRTLRANAPLNIELDVLAKYAAKHAGRQYSVEELTALGF